MPVYNFATYADVREEWVIRADDLDHARALVGDDANGEWLDHAFRLDAEAVECRDEFVLDDHSDVPAIEDPKAPVQMEEDHPDLIATCNAVLTWVQQ